MGRKRTTHSDIMKTKRRTRALILVVLTIFVMTLFTCLLSACNQEYEGEYEYGVYITRVEYDKYQGHPVYDDNVIYMRVYLGLTSDDSKKIEGVTATWHYERRKTNAFKFAYTYHLDLQGPIFSAAVGSLTQEQLTYEGIEYNTFEVYFEYATIYKSMKGEVERKIIDTKYVYDFPIDETMDSFATTFSISTQNSAVWYGLLVAVAAVAFGIVLAVVLTRRKKYATRKE